MNPISLRSREPAPARAFAMRQLELIEVTFDPSATSNVQGLSSKPGRPLTDPDRYLSPRVRSCANGGPNVTIFRYKHLNATSVLAVRALCPSHWLF